MRIPFPLALNVGTDIICINRLLKSSHSTISKVESTHKLTSTSASSPAASATSAATKATLVHLNRLSTRFLHPKEVTELRKRFPFLQQLQESQHQSQQPNHLHNSQPKQKIQNPDSDSQGQSESDDNKHDQNVSETSIRNLATHLAGRWAAKEAAKKAWGATLLSFKDLRIEILDPSSGEIGVICQSCSHENEAEKENGGEGESRSRIESGGGGSGGNGNGSMIQQVAKLSISHDGDYAVATVIATPLHESIVAELRRRRERAWKKAGRTN